MLGPVDFVGFKKKVEEGWVVTQVPAGERIYCEGLYSGILNKFHSHVEVHELIKEVWDILRRFKGKPDSGDICVKYFKDYLKDPIEVKWFKLKVAYENVPKHNRPYLLGDQDRKDGPIRHIIENKEVPSGVLLSWKKDYFYLK